MDENNIESKCKNVWDELTEKYGTEEFTSNEFKIRVIKEVIGLDDEEKELIIHTLFEFIDKIMYYNLKTNKEEDMIYK